MCNPSIMELYACTALWKRMIFIAPREICHPAIINACKACFVKHPSNLTPEEVYKNHKIQVGRLNNISAMWNANLPELWKINPTA